MDSAHSEKMEESVAVVLISKGGEVRVPYSEVYVNVSLDVREWEEDGGQEGQDYVTRLQYCAYTLKEMREHVPEELFDELKAAEALLLATFLYQYVPAEKPGGMVG